MLAKYDSTSLLTILITLCKMHQDEVVLPNNHTPSNENYIICKYDKSITIILHYQRGLSRLIYNNKTPIANSWTPFFKVKLDLI